MTTSLQYQQAIRRALGLSGTDTTALPQADVLEALNAGLQSISTEKEWLWLRATETAATTANDNTVALPTGYRRTIYLSIDDRPVILQKNLADVVGDVVTPGFPAETGYPQVFAPSPTDLVLWPTPDAAYSYDHAYIKEQPILTADGDVPLIPDLFQRWVVVEGAMRLHLRTVSPEKYNELRVEAEGWRQQANRWNSRNGPRLPDITFTNESVWQYI